MSIYKRIFIKKSSKKIADNYISIPSLSISAIIRAIVLSSFVAVTRSAAALTSGRAFPIAIPTSICRL